jgi:hypothetical protein
MVKMSGQQFNNYAIKQLYILRLVPHNP